MIYFDNAATTGYKPDGVINAVNAALRTLSANPGRSGHRASMDASSTVFAAREALKDLFGADNAGNVCFTANCTHSINYVLKGVLRPADHVIISSLEHNAVIRPLFDLKRETGIEIDVAQVDLYDPEKTLYNFTSLIKPNTKMIFTTHASNVTGTIIPIERLGDVCRQRGILFGVDTAQTAGVLPIDMKKMKIDYLCIAPHKGLYAPMGVGVLIAQKPIDRVLISGGTGSNSLQPVQPPDLPERIESGTVNLPGIAGTKAGVQFVIKRGIEPIYRHEMALAKQLYRGLSDLGAILYTPEPERERSVPVVSFNIPGKNSAEVSAVLDRYGIAVRSGLHCAPSAHRQLGTTQIGAVRVAPGIRNNAFEVEKLLSVLKNHLN